MHKCEERMPRGGKLGKIPSKSSSYYRSSTPASVTSSTKGQEVSSTVASVLSELHSLVTQIQVKQAPRNEWALFRVCGLFCKD